MKKAEKDVVFAGGTRLLHVMVWGKKGDSFEWEQSRDRGELTVKSRVEKNRETTINVPTSSSLRLFQVEFAPSFSLPIGGTGSSLHVFFGRGWE